MGLLHAKVTRIPRKDFEEFVEENDLKVAINEQYENQFSATIEGLMVGAVDDGCMGEVPVHGYGDTPKDAVIDLGKKLSRQTVINLRGGKCKSLMPIFTFSQTFGVMNIS